MAYTHYLFDWGNTLMEDLPGQSGPMALWPQVEAVTGAADVLRELSRHGKCHIATNADNSTAEQIRQALQRVGIDQFIGEIFCFREIGHKKPEAAFFEAILSILQVPKTSVVMIGDSLENDVWGALAAGIDAIWLNRGGCAVPEGVLSVTDMDELLLMLKQ